MDVKLSKRLTPTAAGAGYSEFMALKAKVADMRAQGQEVIDFTIGDPKEPKDPIVLEKMLKYLEARKCSGYPTYTGEVNYKKACSEYMKKRFNLSFNADTEICATTGSKTAINLFALAMVDEGDLVICPTPGYPPYIGSTRDAGGEPYVVPLLEENDFLIDFDSIPDDIADKAKMIWVNYPNAPTGAVASEEYYESLISWSRKHNIVIASDEGCYMDLAYDRGNQPLSVFNSARDKDGMVAFYSLSKRNNMTGDSIGFVAGDKKLVEGFKSIQNRRSKTPPSYIQDVGADVLASTEYTDYMVDQYRQKRDLMVGALESIGLEVKKPDVAFYLWQKIPEGMTGMEFASNLLKIGVVVTPGELLSQEVEGFGNPGQDYVRFALVPELDSVAKAAQKITENYTI